MTDQDLRELNRLHRECTDALGEYLKQGTEMCRLLSLITSHPATAQQRQALHRGFIGLALVRRLSIRRN